MNNSYDIYKNFQLKFASPNDASFKFGYYNYSPLSADNSKLLSHKINFEGRMPNANDLIEIGYFDLLNDNKWIKKAETSAFNWQQGAMLQWLGPDYNTRFIFNVVNQDNYCSKIIDLKESSEKLLSKAIYGVTPDGKKAITLNFERSHYTRAYSYAPLINPIWDRPIPKEDGIILLDLETNEWDYIINLNAFLKSKKINDSNYHWFEHIMLNTNGSKFSFYHRFGNKNEFKTHCYISDLKGNIVYEHPKDKAKTYSHLGWKNTDEYVLFTIPQTKLNQLIIGKGGDKKNKPKWYLKLYRILIKPLVPRKFVKQALPKAKKYYAKTNILSNKILDHINPWPGNMDGHPSFTKDGKYMLTDTYADEEGYRHLILFELSTKKTIKVGKFKSVYNKCGWRTDLHPRFSHDEKYIIIDSNHNGKNQMLMIEIKNI